MIIKRKLQKPNGYRRILESQNAKTSKGELLGYHTGICYLSPANESGVIDTCVYASAECRAACLKSSGRMVMPNAVKSRISKTLLLVNDRALFLACLRYDIERIVRRAERLGMIPAVRINGTSDLAWLGMQMADEFKTVQFYDYTKLPKSWLRTRPNYHITFSYSGHNIAETMEALRNGVNVAVVFDTRKGKDLPESWNGYPVIDGDKHDLRFLDGKGVVVGLRAKGTARKIESAFVVKTELIQISLAA